MSDTHDGGTDHSEMGLMIVVDGEICVVDEWIEGDPILRPKAEGEVSGVKVGDNAPVVDIQFVSPEADDIVATVEEVDFDV